MQNVKLMHGDCLARLKEIPDGSVDMVLADPPYGTTDCKWDSIIPLEPMWEELRRVTKRNGAIVLFSAEPFTAKLICSNIKEFRQDLIWSKSRATGFLNANRRPLRAHENICVFYRRQPTYNPQYTQGKPYEKTRHAASECYRCKGWAHRTVSDGRRYPTDALHFAHGPGGLHPTQKPVDLLEWLICTYTNPRDTVLDFCMGSGSTGVAAVATGRDFIGIEQEEKYFYIAKERISKE